MSGLGNTTYRESFNKFRNKVKKESHEWANVVKNAPDEHRVSYHKHDSNKKAPFSPGKTSVWFVKKDSKWHEFGDHGPYNYSNLLKKEAIDDPGASDMGTFGGMGNGVDKEPLETPLNKFSSSGDNTKKKKINKQSIAGSSVEQKQTSGK